MQRLFLFEATWWVILVVSEGRCEQENIGIVDLASGQCQLDLRIGVN
jgi:hypothetical protein